MKKIVELYRENEELKKENEILKTHNHELIEQLKKYRDKPTFTEADLNDIASALEQMFDCNESNLYRDKRTKTKISASQRLDEALAKYRKKPEKENIVKKVMKKNIFIKKR